MKILLVGSGGREHSMAWCFARSESVDEVLVVPGNPGTALENKVRNVKVQSTSFSELAELVRQERVDLTVVGPEQPIADGIRDFFDEQGLDCFAPTKAAGRLESSKSFAKEFMQRNSIPTAQSIVTGDIEEAVEYIQRKGPPIVVKADGLAAGKGVVVARTTSEAVDAAREMLVEQRFGDAGKAIVIEDFLAGEEASFIVLSDGETALPFASSQDHKPVFDGDEGPNTGGMGAYSPAPVITEDMAESVMNQIINPTIRGMSGEGVPLQGFLYVGLMIMDGSPFVVEYNCRFGDPEAQPVLMRLESDLAHFCKAALARKLSGLSMKFSEQSALAVVLSSEGYPGKYETGFRIDGLGTVSDDSKIFHAGTRLEGDEVVTNGGRVLNVVGLGRDVAEARDMAYARAKEIAWPGMHMRGDIGHRAIGR
ncbi:MAG: phosphoribosylamine--glycine ligase [Gammaproteobacteria bacterium]|nr:phosphoribosylamine--glycine ligase [Gammaproteobacteria bacterium]MYD80371.1 phosphoribosylamine--glycine ligase [Gammaproteobacteria bacterium]